MQKDKNDELTIEEISDLIQVYLEVGNFNMELQVLLHGVDVIEDVVHNPGDDSLFVGIVDDPLHGVGLTTGSLSVSEYCSIISTQYI